MNDLSSMIAQIRQKINHENFPFLRHKFPDIYQLFRTLYSRITERKKSEEYSQLSILQNNIKRFIDSHIKLPKKEIKYNLYIKGLNKVLINQSILSIFNEFNLFVENFEIAVLSEKAVHDNCKSIHFQKGKNLTIKSHSLIVDTLKINNVKNINIEFKNITILKNLTMKHCNLYSFPKDLLIHWQLNIDLSYNNIVSVPSINAPNRLIMDHNDIICIEANLPCHVLILSKSSLSKKLTTPTTPPNIPPSNILMNPILFDDPINIDSYKSLLKFSSSEHIFTFLIELFDNLISNHKTIEELSYIIHLIPITSKFHEVFEFTLRYIQKRLRNPNHEKFEEFKGLLDPIYDNYIIKTNSAKIML